ncbi:hypothetical protein INT45_010492 [Circinella minor]|uniref:GATA-type domain-containing protein n=1 Tax=Circinella minor TaxID=1195481 RepID=A0A8H7S5Q7_9FUNG|nr:hypothetical protein INT45_010492 [Circinella minor]
MSNYTILTAKKRTETNIRTFDLPTDPKPSPASDTKNGTLLISLLQSRLNWCHSIFPKYRHDAVQQPRRTNNMRKKWPNMRYLGTCTVYLGAHVFPETTFYEAVRKEHWVQLAKEAGFTEEIADISNNNNNSNNNNSISGSVQQQGEEEQRDQEQADNEDDGKKQQGEQEKETEIEKEKEQTQPQTQPPPETHRELVFTDLVMEFKENAGERFIFPKEAIVEVASHKKPSQLTASFLLPVIDRQDFFRDAGEKVALWGHQSISETIRNFATTLDQPMEEIDENNIVKQEERGEEGERLTLTTKATTQQPVNIRLSSVDEPLLHVLLSTVQPAETVREKMMIRLKTLPTRTYLQYHSTMNKSIMELLEKASSIPDVVHGPVTAEKRRNELLNAIHLGKRPRSDEELLPKSKSAHIKDDGLRKCAYCSAKTTTMWRPGPAGQGTLCNSCGLMWSQGKILKDAPICSKEEQKRHAKEERERRRDEEAMEKENERKKQLLELEQQKQKQEEKQQQQTTSNRKGSTQGKNNMRHTAQVSSLQQNSAEQQQQQEQSKQSKKQKQKQKKVKQKQQEQQTVLVPAPTAPIAPAAPAPAPAPANSTSTSVSASSASTPTDEIKQESRSSLYNNPHGIALPTLSIDFGPSFLFVHPACSILLIDNCFSIRLVKEGFPPVSMMIDKTQLKYAKFQVIEEKQLKREVLTMTVIPEEGPVLHQFNTDLLIPGDRTKRMKIRFLEKLDTHGAVVQRILEQWLTPPVTPTSNSHKSIIEPSVSSVSSVSSTASSSTPSSFSCI